jgi:hypothetical protein
MPVIFSAKLDGSEAVRYTHVSLVAFYLRQARLHAVSAASMPRDEQQFAAAVHAVIMSALCLEAFANEIGETVFSEQELDDFLRSRRRHKKRDGIAGLVTWKIISLFEEKWGHLLLPDTELVQTIESLFELRNSLVHYKLSESSAKAYLPPPARIATDEVGGSMTVFDFMQPASRVEEPLVARVTSKTAIESYNTALRTLKLWNQLASAPDGALSAHQELIEVSVHD